MPKPIQFTPEEADIVADALRDYKARMICQRIVSDATEEEKLVCDRKWLHADNALDKVRAA
jgi:hypothetical protein